jgi:exoribonuclease R
MQYFKEHFNIQNILNNNFYIGTLIKKNDIFYVNANINSNDNSNHKDIEVKYINRAICGDIVVIKDNDIIFIKERMKKSIIGILYLDSKTKYGSLKNKPLYLFKPSNKDYPNFYVPTDSVSKSKTFAVITFKEWKTIDKLPIGTLIETIGLVGNKEAEIEHLRIYYEIRNNTWKVLPERIKKDSALLENLVYEYEVFSIDPIGSKDIDDAFHFKNIGEMHYEIGIHIASPTVFFGNEENDVLNILERVSTVYLTDRKYNLLPNIYADNLISLLENKVRFALSIIFVLDKDLNIISETVKKTVVKNIKNYNYEEFNELLSLSSTLSSSKNMINFMNISKNFFGKGGDDFINFNSHNLVEEWMIYTNKRIANYLINKNCSNIILRKHDSNNINININNKLVDLNDTKDLRLINFLKIRQENSAIYEIYNNSSEDSKQTHSKLGNEYYTHFTSPIRRSVDFAIHLLIISILDGIPAPFKNNFIENIIDKINKFTKNTRKFSRQLRRLEFIYDLKDKNNDYNLETFGYITKITKNKIVLYLPEYNLEEKIIIIPYKLETIVDIEFFDDNRIKYIIDEVEKEYCLYQKVNLRLFVFVSFENIFDKLKIEIL